MKFFDRVRVATTTLGQGTLSFGPATSPNMLTPADAGAVEGDETTYVIEEGPDFEIGRGVVGADAATMTRATVLCSKIGGIAGTAKMSLAGNAKVRFIQSSDDINDLLSRLADKADQAGVDAALAKRLRFDAAQSLTLAEQGRARANAGAGILAGFRDQIINGDGAVNQRTYTTVADDTYWCDRHYVLTQTAPITPTVLADAAVDLPFMMRLTQSQATAQRMGNAQIVEAIVSKRHRGKVVTLGGKLRCSNSQPIRYAVLEWTGAADVVTSDVVSNWASSSFTAGNFFLGANLTVAGGGVITPAANAITDFSLLASVSASCNNLILFTWTEGAAAQGVALDMVWGLVRGDATAEVWPYELRHPHQERDLCMRFLQRDQSIFVTGYNLAGSTIDTTTPYTVEMRAFPTLTFRGAPGLINCTGPVSISAGASYLIWRINVTATGAATLNGAFNVEAEL